MLFRKNSLFWKQHCSSPAIGVVYFSLSLSNIHTLLFPLANTGEAAALGNEPASPVAHTSLQLLTKFHYKNPDYTGEHRGRQEHSFISRYQIEFAGQEVTGLCYALGWWSLPGHTTTTALVSSLQSIPPHSNNSSEGISVLLLWPGVTSHWVMGAGTGWSWRCFSTQPIPFIPLELMVLRALELWNFAHWNSKCCCAHLLWKKPPKPGQKAAGSTTGIWALANDQRSFKVNLKAQQSASES